MILTFPIFHANSPRGYEWFTPPLAPVLDILLVFDPPGDLAPLVVHLDQPGVHLDEHREGGAGVGVVHRHRDSKRVAAEVKSHYTLTGIQKWIFSLAVMYSWCGCALIFDKIYKMKILSGESGLGERKLAL